LVDLYKNRKETAHQEKQYTEQYKSNRGTQSTQNRKQKYKTRNKLKNIKKT